jgi:hypothetical protein
MQDSLREVTGAGFDALIEKPINVLGFLDKVRSVLGTPP